MQQEKSQKSKDKFFKPYEEFIIVNDNDDELKPVRIELPKPPPLDTIDGYDKPPVHQYFRRPQVPHKLIELQKRFGTAEECITELRAHPKYYEDEIKFIQEEWRRRREGYWFFNNGRPTYIPGVHYFYLTCWYHDAGEHFEYRSRDRKFFLFAMMCLQDPFCAGFNYPKFRREGATSKAACFMYWLITMERGKHAGSQSKDGASSEEIFTGHIVPNHRRMPFWYRPVFSGKTDPKKALDFFAPSETVKLSGASINGRDSLESIIDWGTSTEGFYDRAKLRIHYGDEVGKTKEANVYKRHLVVKPTITEGNTYIGIMINTTTVGEMTKEGGDNFKLIASGSMYHQRLSNGETRTGLYNLFIPAYDGYDFTDKTTGHRSIDKYGESDIEFTKNLLQQRRDDLMAAGDTRGYEEEVRMYPMKFRECFRTAAGVCKFNVTVIESVLDKYRFGNDRQVRGNFVWTKEFGGTVEWNPCDNGKFIITRLPERKNVQIKIEGRPAPGQCNLFCAGGDPIKFNRPKGSPGEVSLAAGAVFGKFDPTLDNDKDPISKWKTNKFVCHYLYRPPTKKEYHEDMLMMCIFYGCQMNPETNVPDLHDYFIEKGYEEYLYHKIDVKTGEEVKEAGGYTSTPMKELIYTEWYNYIQMYGLYEEHYQFFNDCREIQDDMNPYDLFVAGGYALMASHVDKIKEDDSVNISSYHRKYNYPR